MRSELTGSFTGKEKQGCRSTYKERRRSDSVTTSANNCTKKERRTYKVIPSTGQSSNTHKFLMYDVIRRDVPSLPSYFIIDVNVNSGLSTVAGFRCVVPQRRK